MTASTTEDVTREFSSLDPASRKVALVSGLEVNVVPLKTRQVLRLVRIITRGAAPLISNLNFKDAEDDGFQAQLIATLIAAFPEAEDEVMEFLQAMVEPVGLIAAKQLDKNGRLRNEQKWAEVLAELDNPELDDFVTIIESIFEHEKEHLASLGKRLATLLGVAVPKTPQDAAQTSDRPSDSPKTSPVSSAA